MQGKDVCVCVCVLVIAAKIVAMRDTQKNYDHDDLMPFDGYEIYYNYY